MGATTLIDPDVAGPVGEDRDTSEGDEGRPEGVATERRRFPRWDSEWLVRVGRHLGIILLFTLPAVVLWWHVWTGHPTNTLTCPCGDPAQFTWFLAWPAWAIAHGHNPFVSSAVNVPNGANLLDNASGPLTGIVLAPITWISGSVLSLNVLLTLAPGLNTWAAWLALRRFVTWKPAAIPGALLYGYAPIVFLTLIYGHGGWAVLVVPPLMVMVLEDVLVRRHRTPLVNGLLLAALIVAQFFLSTEVLLMTGLMMVVGLIVVMALNRNQVAERAPAALRTLGVAVGASGVVLAWPLWITVAGPDRVTGAPWPLAPLAGAPLSGLVDPGNYGAPAGILSQVGGFYGRTGPVLNFLGPGVALICLASFVVARKRRVMWFAAVMAVVALLLSFGVALTGAPRALTKVWLPWRVFDHLPLFDQVIPQRFSLFVFLFAAVIMTVGLEAARNAWAGHRQARSYPDPDDRPAAIPAPPDATVVDHAWVGPLVLGVGLVALAPIAVTYPAPLTVQSASPPAWFTSATKHIPPGSVVLSIPFPASGSESPMLWQATDDMSFRLAGAGMRLPGANGSPLGAGAPGSATAILEGLSDKADPEPMGTPAQILAVRSAFARWRVNQVVISGGRDPAYAAEFLTAVIGAVPIWQEGAWVWTLPADTDLPPPLSTASLSSCDVLAAQQPNQPMTGPNCIVISAS